MPTEFGNVPPHANHIDFRRETLIAAVSPLVAEATCGDDVAEPRGAALAQRLKVLRSTPEACCLCDRNVMGVGKDLRFRRPHRKQTIVTEVVLLSGPLVSVSSSTAVAHNPLHPRIWVEEPFLPEPG